MKFKKVNNHNSQMFINTTSLVDVVFILLIFFAVSTSFFYAGSIRVDLPKATTTVTETSKEMVRVVVTNENKLFIGDQPVTEADLENTLKQMHEATPDASLVIEADSKSLHGIVVTVIDAGKLAGFEKFAIATEEPIKKK